MTKSFKVVWEGVEGSGKTTLMKEVRRLLTERGYHVSIYKTPSESPTGRFAKEYGNSPGIDNLTRMLLFLANTSDDSKIMRMKIERESPDYFFIDRYYLCSIIYGFAFSRVRGADIDERDLLIFLDIVERLGAKVLLKPDLYIIVDVPEEFRIKRLKRKGLGAGLEGKLELNSTMQEYVRRFYRAFVEKYGERSLFVVNPEGKLAEVSRKIVKELLGRRSSNL